MRRLLKVLVLSVVVYGVAYWLQPTPPTVLDRPEWACSAEVIDGVWYWSPGCEGEEK
jgi:hypothetical protein